MRWVVPLPCSARLGFARERPPLGDAPELARCCPIIAGRPSNNKAVFTSRLAANRALSAAYLATWQHSQQASVRLARLLLSILPLANNAADSGYGQRQAGPGQQRDSDTHAPLLPDN